MNTLTAAREQLIVGHDLPALLVLGHQRTVLGRRPTSQAGATDQAVLTTVGWVLLPQRSSRWVITMAVLDAAQAQPDRPKQTR